jgi:uncharacterized damage-inducible protein DinB
MILSDGFNYDNWANKLVLSQIKSLQLESAELLLSHVINAQLIWLSRILPELDLKIDYQKVWTLDEIPEILEENTSEFKKIIESDSMERMVQFSNSKGEQFSLGLEHILFHVIIHGQHHRAQIAKIIRESGGIPKPTDYIFYIRALQN